MTYYSQVYDPTAIKKVDGDLGNPRPGQVWYNRVTGKFREYSNLDAAIEPKYISSIPPSSSSTVGVIAHYTMDNINANTLVDETGNYDGTITGTTQVAGHLGDALSFDSTTDYVTVTGGMNLTGDVSFSFWLLKGADVTLQKPIASSWHGSSNYNWILDVFLGEIRFLVSDGDTNPEGLLAIPIVENSTYFVHADFNSSTGIISLSINDGTPVTVNSGLNSLPNPSSDVHLGHKGDSTTIQLDAAIDQFRVYNRILLPSEVTTLYNETLQLDESPNTLTISDVVYS